MNTLKIPCDVGEVSDGFHSFNELYEHRCTLFLALMKSNPVESWMSVRHYDGTTIEGWFVAGIELATGDITYHLPNEMKDLAIATGAVVLSRGREWDGHTSDDVLKRVRSWLLIGKGKKDEGI